MRRSVGILVTIVTVTAVLAGTGLIAVGIGTGQNTASNPCTGTITSPADGTTVISVQGARLQGEDRGKTQARLVGVGPEGGIKWVHHLGPEKNVVWSYDVDPLPNGNLFGTATRRGVSVFFELDPETGEWQWSETLDIIDTHDADLLDRHRILIANMRNYDEEAGENDDRVLIYNRTSDEVEWEWHFRDHYDPSVGGNYSDDWTHVNDVDAIGDGKYLLSPRNFDQVIVVDRETGEITMQLGSDGDFSVMRKQHNPQYLESEDGNPTILVADSENDRIVEYERSGGDWERTWKLGSAETLSWPRDADRLPNGNTLIADSIGHRVVEVTPEGETVWEFYSPWLVYDVERLHLDDEPGGPTIADQGATGSYELSHDAPPNSELESCAATLRDHTNPWETPDGSPTPTESTGTEDSPTDGGETDGSPDEDRTTEPDRTPTAEITSPETESPGQPGFGSVVAVLAITLLLVSRVR